MKSCIFREKVEAAVSAEIGNKLESRSGTTGVAWTLGNQTGNERLSADHGITFVIMRYLLEAWEAPFCGLQGPKDQSPVGH